MDQSLVVWLAVVPLALFLLHRSLYPKPIPGIPVAYPEGVSSIPWFSGFGPQVAEVIKQGSGITTFLSAMGEGRSVYQVPMGPAGTWLGSWTGLGTNLVCCKDVQEMDDACLRRSNVFTRLKADGEPFAAALPRGQITLASGPEHRHHRSVFGPSMTATYLAKVLPRIEASMDELVELWRERADVMKRTGEPAFEARHDIILATVDVITSIAFGTSFQGVPEATDFVRAGKASSASDSPPTNRLLDAVFILLKQVQQASFAGPLGRIGTWYYSKICRRTRDARRDLVELVDGRIAAERVKRRKDGHLANANGEAKKAVVDADHVLGIVLDGEEADLAKGNAPLAHDDLRDELLTFIFGGSETTATALGWTVKYLCRSPAVQTRLHDELAAQVPGSLTKGGGLELEELQDEKRVPYFHAVVWECLRLSQTAGGIGRTTSEDAIILGHAIPKGTTVVFLTAWMGAKAGDGKDKARDETFTKEGKRGGSSATRRYGWWDESDVDQFVPERWLKTREDGTEWFDRNAGPWPVFGSGSRGCFGKALAILEMKVAIAKMVGAFWFEPVPPELDGDAAEEVITRHPKQSYVRLRPYDH